MEYDKFLEHLHGRPEMFRAVIGELETQPGIYVENKMFDTTTHFTNEAIDKHNLAFLLHQTTHGRNVKNVTRVIGFFHQR